MAVLINLGLGSNNIGPEGDRRARGAEVGHSGVDTLYLGWSSIDDEGPKAIAVPCPRAQRC